MIKQHFQIWTFTFSKHTILLIHLLLYYILILAFLCLVSCHVNLFLVLQNVLWLPSLQAFSSLVKGLYRNIDIRKYSFLTIDEMSLHSNLFHTTYKNHHILCKNDLITKSTFSQQKTWFVIKNNVFAIICFLIIFCHLILYNF